MDKSINENFAQNNRKSRISDFGIFFGGKAYEIFVKRFFKREKKKMTILFEHRLVMTCRLASLFLLVRETAAVCMTCNYHFVISLFLQFDRISIYMYMYYKLLEPLCLCSVGQMCAA